MCCPEVTYCNRYKIVKKKKKSKLLFLFLKYYSWGTQHSWKFSDYTHTANVRHTHEYKRD